MNPAKSVPGSSPRTRGTLHGRQQPGVVLRFIPAYTGNSRATTAEPSTDAVHPRVHGELIIMTLSISPVTGSSPRTRGTPSRPSRTRTSRRFIPAYTGNSSTARSAPRAGPVHPRVHGELGWWNSGATTGAGSSPRTRGTHPPGRRPQPSPGFIPAYTGNSLETRPAPRARAGSSPRTRGTLPDA